MASVRGIVEQWAARRPTGAALLAPGRPPCSWSDLLSLIDDTAAHLGEFGLGPGQVVAVSLPSGPELAAAMLGVCGSAVCAPLNPEAPEAEVAAVLRRLGAEAVVVAADDGGAARRAADVAGVPVHELHADDVAGRFRLSGPTRLHDRPRHAPTSTLITPDTTLVMETSGTTGRPKIVARNHAQVMTSSRNIAKTLELGPDDRALVVVPLFLAHGFATPLLASLIAGGGVICTPGFDGRRFFESVDTQRATWVSATPPMHHALATLASEAPERAADSPLRLLRSGSAALPPAVVDTLETAFGAPLIVGYASTEAGIIASERPPPALRKRGSVGTSAGPELAIVDDNGRFVPHGVSGEVVTRGESVIVTYGDEQADAEGFVCGWLRTGDFGVLDDDGFLTITGRLKEVINRGGNKVSPMEVEAVLIAHPSVAEVAVFPVPHRALGEEIAAVVVSEPGATVPEVELRRHVAEHLSPAKVPRRILHVDRIPVGTAGKVQRIGLAAALEITELIPQNSEGPATAMEASVAGIWARALRLETLGRGDEFISLGGDSLAATQITAMVDEMWGVSLSEGWLVEGSATVATMAEAVERAIGGASAALSRPIMLRPGRVGRRPFFGVSGLRGSSLNFHRLALSMPWTRPFYGLQAPGLNEGEVPLRRISELAAHYLAQVRAIQPTGPYSICGYSFGGMVAYEMGCQLVAQGEVVEQVVIIDTLRPGLLKPSMMSRFKRRIPPGSRSLLRLARRGPSDEPVSGQVKVADTRRAAVMFGHRRAAGRYRPGPLAAPLVVFSTEQHRGDAGGDASLGWAGLAAGPFETHSIPGTHGGIIRHPNVEVLAATLAAVFGDGIDRP